MGGVGSTEGWECPPGAVWGGGGGGDHGKACRRACGGLPGFGGGLGPVEGRAKGRAVVGGWGGLRLALVGGVGVSFNHWGFPPQ